MFAYCNDNPVAYADKNGRSPDDFAGFIGAEVGRWLYEVLSTDPNERDASGNLSLNAKIKRTAISVSKNLEISAGIGLGLYVEDIVLDVVGVSAGMYVTNASVVYSDGTLNVGQEAYGGISATIAWIEIGAAELGFRSNGDAWQNESWVLLNDTQDSITLFSTAVFAGVGGCARVGFDLNSFLGDIADIWEGN